MQKLAIIIGAIALLAGVAAAGTFASLGSGDTQPTISTEPLPATTRVDDARRDDRRADRRNDRREDRAREARGRENEAGEDVRGPCDEAEHANDPRCAGTPPAGGAPVDDDDDVVGDDDDVTVPEPAPTPRVDNSGPGSMNSGPGSVNSGRDDDGDEVELEDHSGPGHGGDDDSGDDHGGGSNSGPGGGDDD